MAATDLVIAVVAEIVPATETVAAVPATVAVAADPAIVAVAEIVPVIEAAVVTAPVTAAMVEIALEIALVTDLAIAEIEAPVIDARIMINVVPVRSDAVPALSKVASSV